MRLGYHHAHVELSRRRRSPNRNRRAKRWAWLLSRLAVLSSVGPTFVLMIVIAQQSVRAVVWGQPALPNINYRVAFVTVLVTWALAVACAYGWQLVTSSTYYSVPARRRYRNWQWLYWLRQWQLQEPP